MKNWYDFVAPIYDWAIQAMYRPFRESTGEALQLAPGQTVLDLGCGSGLNFESLIRQIGPSGLVIGVDFSQKMLLRAQEKIDRSGWTNVRLVHLDVRQLTGEALSEVLGESKALDRVICTLGFSVFPEWREVFARTFDLLAPGGRYALMDLHQEKKTPNTRVVDFLASSEISRQVWVPLEECSLDFQKEFHALPHGSGTVVIASGQKKPRATLA